MTYPPIPAAAKLPVPIGTPADGDVPTVSQVSPLELEWTAASGTGTVTSVTAADLSIVVTGTDTVDPEIATAALDVIAAEHPPAGNWSNNGKKITSQANGTASTDSAAYGQTLGGGNLAPLTTSGDLLIANATPAPARLPIGSVNEVLGISGGLPAYQLSLTLQATTGAAGFALVNGTPNILSWTAPNDSQLHRFAVFSSLHVTSNETGGTITITFTMPDGTAFSGTLYASGASSGGVAPSTTLLRAVEAGTTVAVTQSLALTGGAATLWAEIWAA